MELEEVCFNLRYRRLTFLPDERFLSAVAFVDGFNAALDGVPLRGFREWVAQRVLGEESNLRWFYTVAAAGMPEIAAQNWNLAEIPDGKHSELIDELINLLEEFIRTRQEGS
ncbi:hypothetical protein GCM10010495_65210 [Kitasatospora herbaricolor]|uniref:hypothetical protein n=1 Tax=Kitasatospora herbaricolor TaxID=68217 RepID=UPI001749C3FF|nr:hypothetical protein [Kitasatospora herbaricolor]MDQ0313446.1 hypothetical protein [Kitasatospora herbaricolor]GGV38885.1 hypothetical protein GCM10010495_65210 [Kitasatospora herbaricolor]